jgi:hypothetical protein
MQMAKLLCSLAGVSPRIIIHDGPPMTHTVSPAQIVLQECYAETHGTEYDKHIACMIESISSASFGLGDYTLDKDIAYAYFRSRIA